MEDGGSVVGCWKLDHVIVGTVSVSRHFVPLSLPAIYPLLERAKLNDEG